MHIQASEIADVVGGELTNGEDVTVTGATIDSRAVAAGQLFVPIVAARDGHDFIGSAVAAGATAYLTSQPPRAEVAAAA
ncbi:MAG: UDP-N-acetylmuramoylalanyl-D-glutamyl-2, 6-diaminopimelate--D-alanyl-D-alanine ligase, partial [Gordonia polyisoprenivorans]|nr:UDP-N-acetylmuramoylalanyl-D-glutamyl-2, 6-diaminopimelate--D-alanyl-D-alanine ligase [Gordonia polyisoprenivorans]